MIASKKLKVSVIPSFGTRCCQQSHTKKEAVPSPAKSPDENTALTNNLIAVLCGPKHRNQINCEIKNISF